jgi:outer membrane protein OmpA-like peptidoglycan-associated protein
MIARLAGIALLLLVACGSSSSPSSPKKPGKVVVSDTTVVINDRLEFTSDTELTPASYKTLDAIAATLVENPSIQLVEVRVYVLDGDEATRQQRADQRARHLVDYLVGKQVAAERVGPRGYITPPAADATSHVDFFIARTGPGD